MSKRLGAGGERGGYGDIPVKCRIEASFREPVSRRISSAESSWSLQNEIGGDD